MKAKDLKLADEIYIFKFGEPFVVHDTTHRITRIETEGETTTIRLVEIK
jgi:hypothetical protein